MATKATGLSVQQSLLRCDFDAAAGTDEIGAVLAREAAATDDAASTEDVCEPEQARVRVWLLGWWDFVDSEVERLRGGRLVGARI
ncbi:hypothetical protein ACFVZ3_31380 [Kitasatospora purpeofusca]|uniref:hypothetical protein n=1 Tax=Kitasatospora purpeofusca TaxID=67352 RepID=UPI0036CA4451